MQPGQEFGEHPGRGAAVEALASDRVYFVNDANNGSVGAQRVARVQKIAAWLAHALSADSALAERAAMLAKADLNTNMVGEFPELQGIMGAYYARADHEPEQVVQALAEQYKIRLEKPVNATSMTAAILFIAERAETLIGIW